MTRKRLGFSLAAVLLLLAGLPSEADAFSFNATNFNGYFAWDEGGDVIGEFGLDPRLSYEATGQYFNAAAGLTFDFEYIPTYPAVEDIVDNPTQDWMWTFHASDLCLPGYGSLPDLIFSHQASYADILGGVHFLEEYLGGLFPENISYIFEYDLSSPTNGSAYLAAAGNLPLECLPCGFPEQGFCDFECGANIGVTAAPVPEPLTLILFGSGLAGVVAFRRKRG